MVYYEIESGNALSALSMMDKAFKDENPVLYASALQGFNINSEALSLLDRIGEDKSALTERDYFQIGTLEYRSERCIPALKALKKAKNKISLEEKQERAFYQANCFINLGSSARAAQVLTQLLNGIWISHAYYNLAMAYAENTNKTKALVALKVAESLNAGKTDAEKELNDRVNVAAGQLYLKDEQPNKAIDVLNRVYLNSSVSALALYFRGVAHLENGDFRAATQSWSSVRKYHLIEQGVKESLLAIPFAYERAGYVSQSLEAYSEARDQFEDELKTVKKIESLLMEHGVREVFIEKDKIEGLEWFLTKNVAANTVQAAYYKHFMTDDDIYELIELLAELRMLSTSMSYWQDQLGVFNKALNTKRKNFLKQSKSFDSQKVEKKIATFKKQSSTLNNQAFKNPPISQGGFGLDQNIASLMSRLESVNQSIRKGKSKIAAQLKESEGLDKALVTSEKKLTKLMASVESEVTELMIERIKALKIELVFNHEKAEQGLTHILETIAEMNNRKRKKRQLQDGRYQ